MKTNKFGTKIPDSEEEFWELYNNFEITFVEMVDFRHRVIEVPAYEVVKMLMQGWSFKPKFIQALVIKDIKC